MRNASVVTGDNVPQSSLPFSPAVQVGEFVFVSGQASVDKDGKIVVDTFEGECRRSFENLKCIIEASGLTMEDVIKVCNYVGREEYLQSFNMIYREFFHSPFPARTTLIGCLGNLLKFEVDVVLYKGGQLNNNQVAIP